MKQFDKFLKKNFKPRHKTYECLCCGEKVTKDQLGDYWCDANGDVTEQICKKCNAIKKTISKEMGYEEFGSEEAEIKQYLINNYKTILKENGN